MIINNLWYPTTTNKRTLWWARRDFRAPAWEIAWLAAGMFAAPAAIISVWVVPNDYTRFFFALGLLTLISYMLYDVNYPLQKYVGVRLDGKRLATFSKYVEPSLEDLAKVPGCHRMIDDYLKKAEDDAFEVVLFESRRRSSEFVYHKSVDNLDKQALFAAYQAARWFAEIQVRREARKKPPKRDT